MSLGRVPTRTIVAHVDYTRSFDFQQQISSIRAPLTLFCKNFLVHQKFQIWIQTSKIYNISGSLPIALDSVTFTIIQLPLSLPSSFVSWLGVNFKWVSFLDIHNVHHGPVQPTSLTTFPIAFFALENALQSYGYIDVNIGFSFWSLYFEFSNFLIW